MLGNFQHELVAVSVLGCDGVENGRQVVSLKLDVHNSTNDSVNLSDLRVVCLCAGIASGERGGEVLLDRLEGAAHSGRPAQTRAESSLDAATSSNQRAIHHQLASKNRRLTSSALCGMYGGGCGVGREGG